MQKNRDLNNIEEQSVISEFSKSLVMMNSRDEIYHHTGKTIHEMCPGAHVFIISYNSGSQTFCVSNTFGSETLLKTVNDRTGLSLLDLSIKASDIHEEQMKRYKSRKIERFGEDGINILSAGLVSKKTSREIASLSGIRSFLIMGFTWGDELYGGICILDREKEPSCNLRLVETLVNLAAVAIQRIFTQDEIISSEKKYRTLVETSPDAIVISDTKGNIISCNRKTVELFRFPGELGKDIFPTNIGWYISKTDLEKALSNHAQKIKGIDLPAQEYTFRRFDGTEFTAEVNSSALKHTDGNPQYLISVIRDISERKKVEERLKNLTEQLRDYAAYNDRIKEEERIRLSREIHDILGSSLAGINMNLGILKQIILKNYKEVVPETLEILDSTAAMITDSIGLMRKTVRELRPGILDELGILDAIRWYSQEIQKRSGIVFRIKTPDHDIALDPADANILFRIYQEMLNNIVQHSRATTVNVRVTLKNNHMLLKVADNGKGISKEEMDSRHSFGIMGMKERILLLNGKISLKGVKGKGTSIDIEFPVKRKST